MVNDSPHPRLIRARDTLDDALVALCTVDDGSLPLRAVDEELARGLGRVYAALGASADAELFAESVRTAVMHAERAQTLLTSAQTDDAGWRDCLRSDALALDALRGALFQPGTAPFVLPRRAGALRARASVGTAQLLDPPRPILRPTLPLPEPDEPDEPPPEPMTDLPPSAAITLAALEALMARVMAPADTAPDAANETTAAPAPQPPATAALIEALRFGELQRETDVRFARAQIAIEELGMLAAMRRPDDDDPWTSNRECERRMLCRVDAIVASDLERLPDLIRLLEDRPVPDPELTLAILFVIGSLRGDDSLGELARLLRVIDLERAPMLVAVSDALSLAPHPGIAKLLTAWLEAPLGAQRALAIEVLGRTRQLQSAALARASEDDDVRSQRAAARALRHCEVPVEAAAVQRLMQHDDHATARHALHAAALRGEARALAHAYELTEQGRGAHGDAAIVCAVAGGTRARNALSKSDAPTCLSARGWYGDVTHVPELVSVLDSGDDAQKPAAAEALQRITGAALTDAEPEPDLTGAPKHVPFLPNYREPSRPSELTLDAQVWRSYWLRNEARAQPERRYRHGRPFVIAHDLWEITDARAVRCDRERAHLELRARFGVTGRLDTHAFVLAQWPQVRALAELAARANLAHTPWQSMLER